MAFLQIIKSILSAMFGVRSQKEAEIDFSGINYRWYIVFACVMVALFVLALMLLVKLIV